MIKKSLKIIKKDHLSSKNYIISNLCHYVNSRNCVTNKEIIDICKKYVKINYDFSRSDFKIKIYRNTKGIDVVLGKKIYLHWNINLDKESKIIDFLKDQNIASYRIFFVNQKSYTKYEKKEISS